jgi:sterol desaturase/sphingolipid hydroxylase (fatty acid hydroxylase superfamily)
MTAHHLLDVVTQKIRGTNMWALLLLWISVVASVLVSYVHSGLPRSWHGFCDHLLPSGTLSHPSARADVLFFVTSKFVHLVVAAPVAFAAASIGAIVNHALQHVTPYHPAVGPASLVELLVFTATMLLAYDFSYYIYHNAQHRVPVLWELHKVHHSAEVMVGVTKDRIHPFDNVMNDVWDGLVAGLAYAVWLFFMPDPVELTVYGINVYVLRNILMMDFTRHTHFKISFGPVLNEIIICPHYHQLHHSIAPEHWDKNFGLMFAFWDRLFGTLAIPKPNEDFVFGLTNGEHRAYRSCARLYVLPIVRIARMMAGWAASDHGVSAEHKP